MRTEINDNYLIFSINKSLYAIKNTNVQEIIHWAKLYPLSFVPDYLEGIVNFRGVPYNVVNFLKMKKTKIVK